MFKKAIQEFKNLTLFQRVFALSFTIILLSLLLIGVDKIVSFDLNSNILKILLLIEVITVFSILCYLAVYDILHYEIPGKISVLLPIVLVVITILVGLIIGFNTNITLWAGNEVNMLNKLIGGAIGALVIGLIVFFTKEKGMGEGDIWVIGALGLFIGFDKLVVGFYIAIFSALIVGLLYALKLKQIKGVPVPFVPFLVFGALVAFIFALDYRILLLSL